MTVEVKKVRGKFRLVEAGTNTIARTAVNNVPIDGGGKTNAAPVKRQMGYVNDNAYMKWATKK